MKEKLAHKPFETTLKEMAERDPKPWMGLLLGRPVRDVEVINADLSTIAAEADKLFRIADPSPHLVHSEFETSYKAEHPRKGLRYSVLARVRHGLPVQTIFVLLRLEADGPAFTGTLEDEWPVGTRYLHFRYNVLRIWEMPPQVFLKGDLATLPLAPIARVAEGEIGEIVRQVDERIGREAGPDEAPLLRTATSFLLGLNYSGERLRTLMQGLHGMRESATYQLILEEGKLAGEKEVLEQLGTKLFGPMPPQIRAEVELIGSTDRLRELTNRLLDVSSWEEWMGTN